MNQMDSLTFFSHLPLGFIHPNPKLVLLHVNLPVTYLWSNMRSVITVRQHQEKFSHTIFVRVVVPEAGKSVERTQNRMNP